MVISSAAAIEKAACMDSSAERRLAELHKILDFLTCDSFRAYYTGLTWWRTRWRWYRRRHPKRRWEPTAPPPRFCWRCLPKRLQREWNAVGGLGALRTQLELLEEEAWCPPLPSYVVQHIKQYLTNSEQDLLSVQEALQRCRRVVRWYNTLQFLVRPLYEEEAARLRSELSQGRAIGAAARSRGDEEMNAVVIAS